MNLKIFYGFVPLIEDTKIFSGACEHQGFLNVSLKVIRRCTLSMILQVWKSNISFTLISFPSSTSCEDDDITAHNEYVKCLSIHKKYIFVYPLKS